MQQFTDSTFETDVLRNPLPVIVDFWAEWCGPCKALTPIIEEAANELAGKVVVGKLNVDENPGVASRYSVTSIPTLLFIKAGQVVDQHTGLLPKKLLVAKITKTFGL
jgi:thioredoxin 1